MSIPDPPSSNGLVSTPTKLFLSLCVFMLLFVTILCDSGMRHLCMYYNAKYLSQCRLIPRVIGLEIQTKSNSNKIKPIINPPSSRGLVFAPTTLAFLANRIGPIVTILCDCGIRHLDMFHNAKYLS
ncbi:hypothetical protein CFP56_016821 [Quercus suber]|uniref:Transmembrane protein n=1 Tax=Quercus suber TaxID=58331 RepID=A0AAW0KNV1_QUESU